MAKMQNKQPCYGPVLATCIETRLHASAYNEIFSHGKWWRKLQNAEKQQLLQSTS
jgi:hypothetical protein